jgi:adenylate kinase
MVHEGADGKHATVPMLFGLHVVMLGRQGSGKGTQGAQLARLLVVPHISVGDVLREAARSGSPAGRRAQETMERGELVADDLVVSLVAERLAAADVRSGGFVLDGFPRTGEQAEALAGMLADGTLDRAVVIDVPLEVARARLLARRVCAGCGRIYSVARASGLETWTCGACGGQVRQRDDDTNEAVTRRLTLYDKQTQPLLEWFALRDQLLVVDGLGTSEEVFSRLLAGLWPRIPADRIAQLAGASEPVPTGPAAAGAAEDLSAGGVEVVIEVPRGSRNKYEFDHDRHVLHLDRRLFSATVYPADYGFVPDTLAEDGDPLDALVLLEEPVFPGCWVRARPIGIFWMEDEQGPDAKIICVPLGDPRWDQVRDLDDMPAHLRSEIHHFFDVYKALEPGKSTSTTGFEGRQAALGEIAASRARLEHRQRTAEAASQEVPREAAPAAGGLLVAKMDDEDWLRVISINLSGAFFVAQAALEHMLVRGTGRIINVSSVIGETGNIGQANYAASKSGLFGLTKSLAREAVFMLNRSQRPAGDGPGLTVNGVTPGYIANDMVATIPDKVMERIRGQIPVGRLGRPEEIARVVRFLAADESSYITGQIWAVNGGLDM